ncbi:MAG: hypothetical protein IJS99_08550 [Synergistaceae bacterium]|nr:hypothetical protein [Synergistaceae bacterium]
MMCTPSNSNRVRSSQSIPRPRISEGEENSYSQQFYDEFNSVYLGGPNFDGAGTFYYIEFDGEFSRVYRNYGQYNKDNFLTIQGRVSDWDVINSGGVAYIYYRLSGDSYTIYRRKLTRSGVSNAESCQFDFDGDFAVADSPERLLIVSNNGNYNYTVGLFEFGQKSPARTWSVTVPSDFDGAHYVCYEIATQNVYFGARKKIGADRSLFVYHYLHKISTSGEFERYSPEDDIPGWNEGYYKNIMIFRYGRILWEYTGEAEDVYSVRIYEPLTKTTRTAVYTWTDSNGNERTLSDLFPNYTDEDYTYNVYPDELKNI